MPSLTDVTKQSTQILMRIKTVFPFTFFPDTLVVTPDKVTVTYNTFFYTKEVFPMLMKELRSVTLSTDPFFGSLNFEFIGYETNPMEVKYLKKGEADLARKIITGAMIAQKKEIDLTPYTTDELKNSLLLMGSTRQASY